MAGVQRVDVDPRKATDVQLLPLSDKRPGEEPTVSPHSQQLLVAPMDQTPSAEKATWLNEAGRVPENIARILGA